MKKISKASSIIERLAEAQYKSDSPTEFEEAIRDAFNFLGFDTELMGVSGETDVLLTARIGQEAFRVNVDAKTTKREKISDRSIDWLSLDDHKEKTTANFVVVVAPDFARGNLERRAKDHNVSLLKTDDLIRLVKSHSNIPLTLIDLKDLFTKKGGIRSQVEDLLTKIQNKRVFWDHFRIILEEMQSVQDRLGFFTANSLAVREKLEKLEIKRKSIEEFIHLLTHPFIEGIEKLPEGKYILKIKTKDLANIFRQVFNLLVEKQEEVEVKPSPKVKERPKHEIKPFKQEVKETHLMEENEITEEVPEDEIRYDFIFEFIEDPKWDKQQFFDEYGIKFVQAYVYTKREGKITGIVFQGYKSRIENALEKGTASSWDTTKSVGIENLFVGMDVYVTETNYDGDTNKRTDDPKVRIRGKLKEVNKMKSGRKVEKLFPKEV